MTFLYVRRRRGSLLAQLSSPSKPLPSFIEGWAANSFHGQDIGIPAGVGTAGIAADSEGERILNMTVSGASGATSLTGAGFDTVNGAGTWSGSIIHDDGTYGIYTLSGITGTTITCSPGLRATVTSKNLSNLGGTTNGQHYGLQGYQALASSIFSRTKGNSYRVRYADKFTAATDATTPWSVVGGLSAANPRMATANAFPSGGAGSYFNARGSRQLKFDTAIAGRGVTRTVALGGKSGYLEAFVGIDNSFGGSAFTVTVVVDTITLLSASYTALQRVVVPFTSGVSGTITITNSAAVQTEYTVGDVTWWTFDRTFTSADPVIDKNDKVVVLGDSWWARYSGGLGLKLAALQTAAGGTTGSVTTVALGGQTAEWGLSVFDAQVRPLAPTVVVIEFFTNDKNSFGVAGYDRWLNALYQIGLKCQQIGARPVFVMPLPTQSTSQSADHGVWSEKIGAGLPR